MNPGLVDFLRILIVTLGVNCVVLAAVVLWPYRRTMPHGWRLVTQGGVLVLIAVSYATLESALRQVPGAPRLWWLVIGLLWLWVGLVVTLMERKR